MLSLLLTACLAAPAPETWAGHESVTLLVDFAHDAYAWRAAGNPYPFGTGFRVADGAWAGTERSGYLGFDGRDNLPLEAGSVLLRFRAAAGNPFADGQRRCLLSLPRTTEGMHGRPELWPKRGLALSVRKTEPGRLDLIAHVGGTAWMWDSQEQVLASLDATGLDPMAWHDLAVSWDFGARKVWLALDGQVKDAAIPAGIEGPHEYLAAVLGNTQQYTLPEQEPSGCVLDQVVVLNVPYPQVAAVMAAGKPLTATRPPVPKRVAKAVLFPDEPDLARCEQAARQHLDLLVETQRHGGWCLAVKWPSLLQYTAKFRLPEPRHLIWLSKDGHTAFGAAQLLWAWQCLGDQRYLDAARRTGDMYQAAQAADGSWHHAYTFEDGRYLPEGSAALLQDHCQTGPLMLLCYLHHVTGEQRYLDAAGRSADFLVAAQNSNGSWSHHWNAETKVGEASNGEVGGGEVNDYGTSAPIATLLNYARLTGQTRYREAALRGAEWLLTAFIDKGQVAGWAGQYDQQDKPVAARHFEPPAVTQYGARWAASGLLAAYAETREDKYLAPLKRVLEWFDANQGEGGWWWDYDLETGRPIVMYQRQIYFVDDPAQLAALVKANGGRPPTRGDWVNVKQLRYEVEQAVANPLGRVSRQPTREQLAEYVKATAPAYVKSYLEGGSPPLNQAAGLYTWETDSGLSTSLVRHQVVRFCDLLMRARAARGDLPAADPLFRRIDAFVGWNKIFAKLDQTE